MNKLTQALLGGTALIGAGLLMVPEASAQLVGGTVTNNQASRGDSATFLTGPFGGRTTCASSQDSVANLTVSMTPLAGQYVYITSVAFTGLANATGATSTTVWSSTNLGGGTAASAPAWLTPTTASAAANPTGVFQITESYPTALKAAAPGAVTLVPSATTASAFLCPRVAWYSAP